MRSEELPERRGEVPVRVTGRPIMIRVSDGDIADVACGSDPGCLDLADAVRVLAAHHACLPGCVPRARACAAVDARYAVRPTGVATTAVSDPALDQRLTDALRRYLHLVETHGKREGVKGFSTRDRGLDGLP